MCSLAGLASCRAPAPHTRLGSLPFPGTFTLYTLADPNDLGRAHYDAGPNFFTQHEHGHGILYTRRAGFIDLAHVRESMDWSWYAWGQVSRALTRQQAILELPGYDGCAFRLNFNYPPYWASLDDQERQRLINELALRIGERVAFNAMTWHEIITWYGYKTTLVLPEQQSSFTYEDTVSHMVGIYAADDAMRNPAGTWDEDATRSLDKQLDLLGVVSPGDAEMAVYAVQRLWWENGHCIRRNLDIGQDGAPIRPWLVRGMPWGESKPAEFFLPAFSDVHGRDLSGFWSMTIKPSLLTPKPVQSVSSLPGHLIDPEVHFPILVEKIKQDMKKRFGPNADMPYDSPGPAEASMKAQGKQSSARVGASQEWDRPGMPGLDRSRGGPFFKHGAGGLVDQFTELAGCAGQYVGFGEGGEEDFTVGAGGAFVASAVVVADVDPAVGGLKAVGVRDADALIEQHAPLPGFAFVFGKIRRQVRAQLVTRLGICGLGVTDQEQPTGGQPGDEKSGVGAVDAGILAGGPCFAKVVGESFADAGTGAHEAPEPAVFGFDEHVLITGAIGDIGADAKLERGSLIGGDEGV
jgi:hypothetical protein